MDTHATVNKTTKIIKRYQNRKLYDTQQSCYVTLEDIAKMIRANEDVTIIDNKTKRDITASTLGQIIFEAEKKAADYAPLSVLRSIIQHANGTMSSYLAKLGVFTAETKKKEEESKEFPMEAMVSSSRSYDDVKSTLDSRVAAAADKPLSEPTLPTSQAPLATGAGNKKEDEVEATPELPTANRNFSSTSN